MEPVVELVGEHSDSEAFEGYIKGFEFWNLTWKDVKPEGIGLHFFTLIDEDACGLLKYLAFTEKPIYLFFKLSKKHC